MLDTIVADTVYSQVIGSGIGNYDANTATFNLADPPLRDTLTVAKGGWAAFRFLVSHTEVIIRHR